MHADNIQEDVVLRDPENWGQAVSLHYNPLSQSIFGNPDLLSKESFVVKQSKTKQQNQIIFLLSEIYLDIFLVPISLFIQENLLKDFDQG